MFQNYSLFSHMDVAENIAFGPKIHGKPRDYIRDKIRYALKLVNLDAMNTPTSSTSPAASSSA